MGGTEMKKKRILSLAAVLTAAFILFSMTSCQKKDYGKSYGEVMDSKAKLVEKMESESLAFKYPEYLGEAAENAERQYMATKGADDEKFSGYKIYQFGSPFFTSVTAYAGESEKLLSDEESRTEQFSKISSEAGEITLYKGLGHKDALYLIGCINIDGSHYEIRITSDKEMDDSGYTHAIYEGNEYYDSALTLMAKIAESIK